MKLKKDKRHSNEKSVQTFLRIKTEESLHVHVCVELQIREVLQTDNTLWSTAFVGVSVPWVDAWTALPVAKQSIYSYDRPAVVFLCWATCAPVHTVVPPRMSLRSWLHTLVTFNQLL